MKAFGPIVIGASGGSGTRVISEILIRSGVYLGQDLNKANDNLLFTYLFKQPGRFAKDLDSLDPMHKEIFAVHEKLLLGKTPSRVSEFKVILRAGWDHVYNFRRYNWKWILQRLLKIVRSKPLDPIIWGWKEPNTVFFLHGLRAYCPSAKFILVLRNGLDMAYSKNDQQLRHWSTYFQMDYNDLSPQNMFEYWYRLNKWAIVTGRNLFADDFLVVRHEDLCLRRDAAMQELFDFIGIDINKISSHVRELPQLPRSYGRYRKFDTKWIDSEVRRKLADLGYEVA